MGGDGDRDTTDTPSRTGDQGTAAEAFRLFDGKIADYLEQQNETKGRTLVVKVEQKRGVGEDVDAATPATAAR